MNSLGRNVMDSELTTVTTVTFHGDDDNNLFLTGQLEYDHD